MFSGKFSNVFFLSMMHLFLSLLKGTVIFLLPEKRGIYRNLAILSWNGKASWKSGFQNFFFFNISQNSYLLVWFSQISFRINRKCNKFWVIKITAPWCEIESPSMHLCVHLFIVFYNPELYRFVAYTKNVFKKKMLTQFSLIGRYYILLHLRNRSISVHFCGWGGRVGLHKYINT
jgi:hypothetical protein